MKHLSIVMIFLLWFAVFACTNDLSQQHDTEQENPQGTEQGQPEQPGLTEQPEIKEPEISGEGESEPIMPEVEQPVIEPQEEKPPIVELPIIEPPVVEPLEQVLMEEKPTSPEIRPPNEETPEVIPPVIVPPINALLVINELRTEYSRITQRYEFIEFKVKRAGNLNGIRLFIMADSNNPFIYDFPSINVALGEYITLHLQTPENNFKDELGDNLELSGGNDSCPTARDLWVVGSKELLCATDIVYLEDDGNNVMDAVVLSEKPSKTWGNDYSHFAKIEEFLFYEGAWKAANGSMPTPLDVVNTSSIKSSTAKSVCRYEGREISHTASDWYISGSGTTPGLPNN